MSRSIGIDLGTTYSAVAVVNGAGRPEVVRNRDGENLTPSVVLFQDGTPLVGSMAKRSAVMMPAEDMVQFVKRQMGDPHWRCITTGGQEYTAEQISAMILKRLKEDAESVLGQPCLDAVITVPAYFDDARRKATADAGKMAGLRVLRVLNEPTAAALAYGLERLSAGCCLVYDLGGGTFDVTVLRIESGNFDVLSTTGDRNLGGFDWDNALMSFVDERVRSEGGPDLLDGGQLETDLREKCEMAKRTLSNAAQAKVFVSAGGRSFTVAVTREQFESMTSGLVERTGSMVEEVLEDAGLRRADVDHVLLVGGSTRMPMVQAMMRELMGREPDTALHPDEAVALGAAIQAALIDGAAGKPSALDTAKPITVEDVTSQSLGVVAVEDAGGRHRSYNSIIIPHNTKVPCQHRNRYATVDDGQTQLKIEVTEGDDEDLDYVTLVGHSTLTIPPYPAGAPVEVIMSYDIDGMIHVEVVDLTSGSHLGEFELERAANRGGAELEAMADAVRRVEVQ